MDYTTDQPLAGAGLARLAPLIHRARAEVAGALLLDNGDFLFGNPLGDLWTGAPGPGRACAGDGLPAGVHPMVQAMNALGYDAVALGNHEFNFGLPALSRALASARFPVLASNLWRSDGAVLDWVDHAILHRRLTDAQGRDHDIAIGLLAVMPPQVMKWDATHLRDRVRAGPIVATIRAAIPRLRARGADIIVLLNHSGIGDGSEQPEAENAGLALARLPGVDAVICGHQHRVFPEALDDLARLASPIRLPDAPAGPGSAAQIDPRNGSLAGRPAVMAGFWGSHLGIVDLTLAPRASGGWRVAGHEVSLRVAQARPECPALIREVACDHDRTRRYLDALIGEIAVPVSTHYALLGRGSACAMVAEAQRAAVARALAGRPEASLPLVAAAAPLRCGGAGGPGHFVDFPAGALRERDLHAICGFPNHLQAVVMSADSLHDWLEQASGVFETLQPGLRDQPLIAPDVPSYNFDTIFGLSYQIDLSRPPRVSARGGRRATGLPRVCNMRWQGQPILRDQKFVVATNNYRAQGGGGFAALRQASPLPIEPISVQDALRDWVISGAGRGGLQMPGWRFAPMPATSAVLRTSARAALPDWPGARRLGLDAEGFQLISLPMDAPPGPSDLPLARGAAGPGLSSAESTPI